MRISRTAVAAAFWFSLLSGSARADIRGEVIFPGAVPPRQPVDRSTDPACVRLQAGPAMPPKVVHKGRVADAFVYLVDPPASSRVRAVRAPAEINLTGCVFAPRVLGVVVGQKLRVTNQDPTLHTVHVKASEDGFLKSLPRKGQSFERRMRRPEIMIPIESRSHPWMRAYVGVVSHPYFGVSGRDGSFVLPTYDLPDGTYQLRLWHPDLGGATTRVQVRKGEGRVVLTLDGRG